MKRTIIVLCVLVLISSTLVAINPIHSSGIEMATIKITSPEGGSEVKGLVTITAENLACYCNGKTSLYVDDEFVCDGTRTGMSDDGDYEVFTHEWDRSEVEDGTHSIKVFDKHGDYYDEISLIISNGGGGGNEQPDLIRIISPEANAEVKGTVTITAENLACFCLEKTSLYVDGEFVCDGTRTGMSEDGNYEVFTHEWDTSSASNGGHSIRVFDKHAENSDRITVFINNEGSGSPGSNLRIISPQENELSNGKIIFKVEVKSYEEQNNPSLYVNNEFVSEGQYIDEIEYDGEPFKIFMHEWDSTEVENGEYTIKIQEDSNGDFDEIKLLVDNKEAVDEDELETSETVSKGVVLFSGIIGLIVIIGILVIVVGNKNKRGK